MCLIDPQAHTSYVLCSLLSSTACASVLPLIVDCHGLVHRSAIDIEFNSCHEYWDGGSEKINVFLRQHAAVCHDNFYCRQLHLATMVVQPKTENEPINDADSEEEGAPKKKTKRRSDIDYILIN